MAPDVDPIHPIHPSGGPAGYLCMAEPERPTAEMRQRSADDLVPTLAAYAVLHWQRAVPRILAKPSVVLPIYNSPGYNSCRGHDLAACLPASLPICHLVLSPGRFVFVRSMLKRSLDDLILPRERGKFTI
jgi:hypothetical protein